MLRRNSNGQAIANSCELMPLVRQADNWQLAWSGLGTLRTNPGLGCRPGWAVALLQLVHRATKHATVAPDEPTRVSASCYRRAQTCLQPQAPLRSAASTRRGSP